MPIKTNIPQVAALRATVANRFGHTVECRNDFLRLVCDIERVTHEHVAENTLRRLWEKIQGYDTVFIRTLDVLSKYCGHANWEDFQQNWRKSGKKESSVARDGVCVNVKDLSVGDRLQIGWLPDRMCIVEFGGGRMFKAIDCQNSTIQAGDTFECSIFIKNFPLFVDNMVHGGEICQGYAIGTDSGLTTLKKL